MHLSLSVESDVSRTDVAWIDCVKGVVDIPMAEEGKEAGETFRYIRLHFQTRQLNFLLQT